MQPQANPRLQLWLSHGRPRKNKVVEGSSGGVDMELFISEKGPMGVERFCGVVTATDFILVCQSHIVPSFLSMVIDNLAKRSDMN
jgi:hypothetical protein